MQQFHGYDFKDIWSFGITALELAHGHAPFSKYPPMKVLLMTLQIAPPGLDYERDKIFKGLIGSCLLGEGHKKRPTLEKLIKHHFFKHARPTDYLFTNLDFKLKFVEVNSLLFIGFLILFNKICLIWISFTLALVFGMKISVSNFLLL
ncbi:hypothetical protein UlMin_015471 [Ulmus minor]